MLVLIGCGKTPPSQEPGDVPAESAQRAASGGKRIIPILRDPRSLEGNWVLLMTVEGRDKYLWIVKISKAADGSYGSEIIDRSNDELEPAVTATSVEGDTVRLSIKNKNATFDFEGRFDGVAIRGSVGSGLQVMYLSRMLSTTETRLADYLEEALPPAADVFRKAIEAMQNVPQPKVILELAREHRNSPVSMEAVFGLLNMMGQAGFDDETVEAILDQYLDLAKVWGRRVTTQAEFLSARQLVMAARLPDRALKHLDAAEKLLGPDDEAMKAQIQLFREQAEIQVSLVKAKSKSDEDRAAAYKELQGALKKQPYNPDILLALGQYAIDSKDRSSAIQYLSDVVALPMLELILLARRAGQPAGEPTVTDILKGLWTEEHGSTDSLSAAMVTRLNERLTELKDQTRGKAPSPIPEDAGNHRVLVELFTGGQSPPSVAAEVGLDALLDTYPITRVIALRYHQHIPGPDGLVNQDSEDRFAAYELAQTPTLVVDGSILDPNRVPYTGYLQAVANAYYVLRSVVDTRLQASTPITLNLSAKIEQGELALHAAVEGATEEQLQTLRLRLALAEEVVDCPVPIGLRTHTMVVREMPGGARGILPKKGELKFDFTMPASDLQKHLDDYLARYEAGNRIEIPAESKPPIRGRLFLVGWVQDERVDTEHPERSRAILQTALVPVISDASGAESAPVSAASPANVSSAPMPSPPPNGGPSATTDSPTVPPAPALPED